METGSWLESIILDYLVVSSQLLLLAGTKELVHFWEWLKSIVFEHPHRVRFPAGQRCVVKWSINGSVVGTQRDTWAISLQIQRGINVFCYFFVQCVMPFAPKHCAWLKQHDYLKTHPPAAVKLEDWTRVQSRRLAIPLRSSSPSQLPDCFELTGSAGHGTSVETQTFNWLGLRLCQLWLRCIIRLNKSFQK